VRHLHARIRGSLELNAVVLQRSRIAAGAHFEGHVAAIHFAFLDWGACIVSAEEAAASIAAPTGPKPVVRTLSLKRTEI
jgi:hypothetical protein